MTPCACGIEFECEVERGCDCECDCDCECRPSPLCRPRSRSRSRSWRVPTELECWSWRCAAAFCLPSERMLAKLARRWAGAASCDRRGRAGTGTSPMPPAWSGLMKEAWTRELLRLCSSAVVRDAFDNALIRGDAAPYRWPGFSSSFSMSQPLTRWPQLSESRPPLLGGSYGPLYGMYQSSPGGSREVDDGEVALKGNARRDSLEKGE
ncbi:hypothetical protein GSI_07655 [Ganoderma sinense ZZ0214-1]|uniref:Uncharacterized protein n=1 Tax=Ganoderma sinense ZZ0214-1 TaxID=1077348 RepID=A0A2G8S953_9APHY|nr:hypothetical protein GSI_07655 [Ganoderma sinense ZZ0214-1]